MGFFDWVVNPIGEGLDAIGIGPKSGLKALAPGVAGAFGLFGDDDKNAFAREMFDKNVALQKEFAQNGVSWKIEDAAKHGIHPLAAIGASGTSFSPVAVGESGTSERERFAAIGQDISRAMSAGLGAPERSALISDLQVERAGLENELLRSQIGRLNSAQSGPAMPVSVKPLEVNASDPLNSACVPAPVTDYGYVRTADGGLAIVPSTDAKERIEDAAIPEGFHALRNNLMPNFNSKAHSPDPSRYPPPKGYDSYKWSPVKQQYIPWKKAWDRDDLKDRMNSIYKKRRWTR